jgi:TatD DNase family protein
MKNETRTLNLIDAHVHLDMIRPVEPAIANARAAGISVIVAVGMDIFSNRKTLELSRQFPGMVYPALGYHPWNIKEEEIDKTLAFLDEHLKNAVALGEVGLDYKVKVKKEVQHRVFESVLDLAEKYGTPVNVHSRYSYERTHAMVTAAHIPKAVFHWYSGPMEVLDKIIADGYCVSATPALAYSYHHREAMIRAPLSNILIETDAPVEFNGKPSEPATLVETLHELARLKEMPVSEIAQITSENSRKFYALKEEPG